VKELLERLRGSPGIDEALIMTLDGILVTSLNESDRNERIAAFVSASLLAMEKDAEELGLTPFRRLTLWEAKGRLIVLPLADFALVVVADRDTDLSFALMETAGLAKGLVRQSKIDVEV